MIVSCETTEFDSQKLNTIFDNVRNHFLATSTLIARFQETNMISNQLCLDHTGFSKEEFCFILNELTSLKHSPGRTREQALALFLTWLKTGLPQSTLATFFGIEIRQSVSEYCKQVRNAFEKDFVINFWVQII